MGLGGRSGSGWKPETHSSEVWLEWWAAGKPEGTAVIPDTRTGAEPQGKA